MRVFCSLHAKTNRSDTASLKIPSDHGTNIMETSTDDNMQSKSNFTIMFIHVLKHQWNHDIRERIDLIVKLCASNSYVYLNTVTVTPQNGQETKTPFVKVRVSISLFIIFQNG